VCVLVGGCGESADLEDVADDDDVRSKRYLFE
jgi:hypothetical protein